MFAITSLKEVFADSVRNVVRALVTLCCVSLGPACYLAHEHPAAPVDDGTRPVPDAQPEMVPHEPVPQPQPSAPPPGESGGQGAEVQVEPATPSAAHAGQGVENLPEKEVPRHLVRPRPRADEPAVEAKLGEILEELRSIRREGRYADFSIAQLVGSIAQALALCAVGWGLYQAINGETAGALLRILIGIAFQLMALTGFSFGRKN